MINKIPEKILSRMKYLESIHKKQMNGKFISLPRLSQIPPETGKFISFIASYVPEGEFIEIGTSAGYSTMWLSLAAMERKIKIKTFEIDPEKIKLAKETFEKAGIEKYVELIEGDFLKKSKNIKNVSFCFLDADKEIYEDCFNIVSKRLVKNGIIIADNALSHYRILKPFIKKLESDKRFDSFIVPIGSGELVIRKT